MTSRPEDKYPRSSSFYAYDNCEASFQLSQASGEDPPNPFSDRGTKIHAWEAAVPEDKPGIGLDSSEMETAVDLQIQERAAYESWNHSEDVEVRGEERLWFRDGLIPVYSGKPDRWYVSESDRALLIDFKTGWHPLDAYVATNCQLRSYVPLIDEELDGRLRSITAAIFKPGKKFPPAHFGRNEINAAREWAVFTAQRAASTGKKIPNRGAWCKYCSGKVLCPAWKNEIEELSDLLTSRITDLPDHALAAMAPKLDVAKTVIEKLQERLYARVRDFPDRFSDWRFEEGDSRRSVKKEELPAIVEKLVSQKADLTYSEMLECCRLSITDLEKAIRKNRKMSIREVYIYLDVEIGKHMESKQNKEKLVYDPRPNEITSQTELQETETERALSDRPDGDGETEPGSESEDGNLEPGESA